MERSKSGLNQPDQLTPGRQSDRIVYPPEIEEEEQFHYNRSRYSRRIRRSRELDQYPPDPERVYWIGIAILLIFLILIIIIGLGVDHNASLGIFLVFGGYWILQKNSLDPPGSILLYLIIVIGLFFFYLFFRTSNPATNIIIIILFSMLVYILWFTLFPRVIGGGSLAFIFFLLVLGEISSVEDFQNNKRG